MLRTALILGLVLTVSCETEPADPLDAWYEETSRDVLQSMHDRSLTLRDRASDDLPDATALSLLDRLDAVDAELQFLSVHAGNPAYGGRFAAVEQELNEIQQSLDVEEQRYRAFRLRVHPR